MSTRFAIETAGNTRGAVAVIRLNTDDPDGVFAAMAVRPVPVGDARVRRVFGLDDALVARPGPGTLFVMPHGGRGVVRVIAERLAAAGFASGPASPPDADAARGSFPEADDAVTARMLSVLARAASPLAIDLLLDQPRRWRGHAPGAPTADAAVLDRLITPPVVAAVGAPNIGKSSLLNAVAGGSVALAFDRPGTTRDAVGVLVELGGLVVRWIDTPGVLARSDGSAADEAARAGAGAVAGTADLVLRCVDAGSEGVEPGDAEHPVSLVVATRADRASPAFAHDVATSAASGTGIDELSRVVRRVLVPDAALADPRPWRFWESSPATA